LPCDHGTLLFLFLFSNYNYGVHFDITYKGEWRDSRGARKGLLFYPLSKEMSFNFLLPAQSGPFLYY